MPLIAPSVPSDTLKRVGWVSTRPCLRRSSGTSATPSAIALRTLSLCWRGAPSIRYSPPVIAVGAEHGARDLGAARADKADQADDLAGTDDKRDIERGRYWW